MSNLKLSSVKLTNSNNCVPAQLLSLVWLFETLRIVTYKAPLYVGFLKQEYWSALPFPAAPALEGTFFATEPSGKSSNNRYRIYIN